MLKIANIYPFPVSIENNIPQYPGEALTGGGETESFDYAQALSEQGNKVTYMTGYFPGVCDRDLKVNSNFRIKYYKLNMENNFSLSFSVIMFRDMLFGDYNIIHSHQIPIVFSLLGGLAARLSNKRFIITFCGKLPNTRLEKLLFVINSVLAHQIVIQNTYVSEVVGRVFNKNKLVIIPYYIHSKSVLPEDIDRVKKLYGLHNKKIILTLCRLIPAKGVDIIIDAFNKIKSKTDAVLVIAGKGPEEESLRELASKFHILDRVIFTGFVKPEDLFPLYSCASTFVLASTYKFANGMPIPGVCETFALVLGEAMTCGTPVIASSVGGIPCWVKDGYNGLLFNERDSNDLSNQMLRMLDDEKLRSRIVKNSKLEIKKYYSKAVVIRQFEATYTNNTL